jgi:hemoglobin
MSSIYDEIGGKPAVAAAVDRFYEHVLGDPVLAPYFAATDFKRQKSHMRAFLAAALGGPDIYAGRDMGAAHRGMGITHEAFDHVVSHLVATLTELGVAPGTIATIGGALAPLRPQIVEEPLKQAA